MHPLLDHSRDFSRDDARRLQQALAAEIRLTDDFAEIETVGGIHVSFPRSTPGAVMGRAAVVVVRLPDLVIESRRVATRAVTFPFVPELRSFREAPVAIAALAQLDSLPDLLIVNGHGFADRQRFGIANHLGVLLAVPTIGCATSFPAHAAVEPDAGAGTTSMVVDGTDVIGAAIRTRAGSRPVVVSVGHRVSLDTAVELLLRCTRGRRLPEPLHLARLLSASHGPRETATPEGTTYR